MRETQDTNEAACGRSALTAGLGVDSMMRHFLCAIKKNLDGTTDITVFEEGNSCTVTLNKEMIMQLIKELSHQNQGKKKL